uniref:Transcriptional regulator n=1 Tax=Steinernema glaseri TaxID=37863 RepID=A0A1I7YHX3_9BILA
MQHIIANTKHKPTTNAETDCCKKHQAAEQKSDSDNFALFSLFMNKKRTTTWNTVEDLGIHLSTVTTNLAALTFKSKLANH